MRIFKAVLFLSVLGLLAACSQPAPPPPPPQNVPPPEPTPEQQYGEIKSSLSPLFGDGPLDLNMVPSLVSTAGTIRASKSVTENGRQALNMLIRDVEDCIRKNKEANKWRKVKAGCLVFEALQPGSDRYAKTKNEADLMLARPNVQVTGFMESGNDTFIFLTTTDNITGEQKTFKVREGEEFYAPEKVGDQPNTQNLLRIVRIIGNKQAVEIEYKLVNFVWQVEGPRARQGA